MRNLNTVQHSIVQVAIEQSSAALCSLAEYFFKRSELSKSTGPSYPHQGVDNFSPTCREKIDFQTIQESLHCWKKIIHHFKILPTFGFCFLTCFIHDINHYVGLKRIKIKSLLWTVSSEQWFDTWSMNNRG